MDNQQLTRAARYEALRQETIKQHKAAIKSVIDYMKANLSEPYSQQKMANVACYNQWHYPRVFREITGMSPRNYLRTLRMNEACRLLVTTSLGIGVIGNQIGYNSLGTFSLTFTKHMGMSPTDYRKSTIEQKELNVNVHDR